MLRAGSLARDLGRQAESECLSRFRDAPGRSGTGFARAIIICGTFWLVVALVVIFT
jgi:hypothetical protein